MEWKKCYLDVILVPLAILLTISYHVWLWYNVRTQPHTTIIAINASGRRNWVAAMMKVFTYVYKFLVEFNLIKYYVYFYFLLLYKKYNFFIKNS
jgi:hypothetical protein